MLDVVLGRPFVALTVALVVVAWVLHERSVVGLRVAAIGEHPEAAETVGLSVRRHRALAVVASGLIAGLGGAYLALNVQVPPRSTRPLSPPKAGPVGLSSGEVA